MLCFCSLHFSYPKEVNHWAHNSKSTVSHSLSRMAGFSNWWTCINSVAQRERTGRGCGVNRGISAILQVEGHKKHASRGAHIDGCDLRRMLLRVLLQLVHVRTHNKFRFKSSFGSIGIYTSFDLRTCS